MCPHKVDVNVKFDLSAIKNIARHRRIIIEQCIESLTHSCLCHDAFCRRSSCMKMKRVVIHTSICKRKIKGNCPICKQLIALCCYHAKNCKELCCWVPFCNTVKTKMRRQNLLFDRLDAARDLLRASQPDPDESDAIDVNMSGPYPFGDDGASGSGSPGTSASGSADSGSADSSDEGDEGKPDDTSASGSADSGSADSSDEGDEGKPDDTSASGSADSGSADSSDEGDEGKPDDTSNRSEDQPALQDEQSSDSTESFNEEAPLK